MAYATTRIIDRGRNGQVIYEACLCEQHLQTDAPHDLSELEVTPIDPSAKVECTFAHLAPEFRYAGYIDCAKVAAVLLFALLLPTLASAQTAPIVLGNLADAVSTELALARRAHTVEANPVMGAHMAQRLAVKSASTAAQVWLIKKLEKRSPKAAKITSYSIGIALSAVAAHNWRVGQ